MSYIGWIPIAKDVILATAGVIGSIVAILGLNTWRRQLYGQSEYDLATRLLKNLYLFREVISNARHVFMQYSVVPDLPQEKLEQMTKEEKDWHSQMQAWEKRLEPVAKVRADLDTNVLESEVFWGTEIKDKMSKIYQLHGELFGAIQEHMLRTNPRDRDTTLTGEEIKRLKGIMYSIGDRTSDDFLDRMLKSIEEVENILKPYIRKGKVSKKKSV